MSTFATTFRSVCFFLVVLSLANLASAQDRRGEPNVLSSGYYVVDSDDDAGEPWQPEYKFVDTSYSAITWKRIKSGPRQGAPAGYFFYNPLGWSNIPQMDTTNNAMAGPIPLGFSFNYYGVSYDSVYISSNGFIGFRSYAEAAGNPVGSQASYIASQNKDFSNSTSYSSAPPAIIAALWADLDFLRGDSSCVFVRTNATSDTFMVNFYNIRLRPGGNSGGLDRSGGDRLMIRRMQIILAKGDSSIQINYGPFSGAVNVFPPVLAYRLFQNNVSIGLVNHLRNQSTSVLFKDVWHSVNQRCRECNKDFRQNGSWSLKFKQWKNVVRAVKVDAPTPNFELCLGNPLPALKVTVRNVSSGTQSFQALATIRNAATGVSIYNQKVNVINLSSLKDSAITFPAFETDAGNANHQGRLTINAVAVPITPSDVSLGDMWPFDDTVTSTMFGIRRLSPPFRDASNEYGLISGVSTVDHRKWVSLGAEVVDGLDATFDPPSPREYGGAGFGPLQYNSPVIKLDRRSIDGIAYTAGGDTLSTYPINLQGATQANVSFNYQRGGKRVYSWLYDRSILYGPEHTILNSSGGVVRTGDSLIVEFKKPTEPGCNTSSNGWTRVAGIDGGKDLEFKSILLKVENFNKGINYFTPDFRARLRLKTKYDGVISTPQDDDEDPWYIDNFTVQIPEQRDLQVVWTRAVNSYTKVPASQAVFPVYVNVINHSRSTAFDMPIVTQIIGPDGETKYYKVGRFTILSGDTILRMPDWDARNSKEGNGAEYVIHSWIGVKNNDSYAGDDGTYSLFNLNTESVGGSTQEFAYDDAGIDPPPNEGNDWPLVMQRTGSGIGFNNMSGSFAMKFNLARTDTLYGVRIYFGSINSSNDAIRISLFDGTANGNVPGDSVKMAGVATSFLDERKGDFYNQFWTYNFAKPLALPGPDAGDDGYYWLSVSQLSLDNMQLGADISRGGAELLVQSNSPVEQFIYRSPYGTQYTPNSNAGDIRNRLAVETGAGSRNWVPMHVRAVGGTLSGTVIPMIRPLVSKLGLLPVEFAQQLRAEEHDGQALLTWSTANEQDNMGFFIERRMQIDDMWEKVGFVSSKVTNSSSPVGYTYIDANVDVGTYTYRLIQIDLDGTESLSNLAEVQIGASGLNAKAIPGFALRSSYPNPFDPAKGSTRFTIESHERPAVSITVYNGLGQRVRSLGTHSLATFKTELAWDGKGDSGATLSEGTYIIQVIAGDRIERLKVHLTR